MQLGILLLYIVENGGIKFDIKSRFYFTKKNTELGRSHTRALTDWEGFRPTPRDYIW